MYCTVASYFCHWDSCHFLFLRVAWVFTRLRLIPLFPLYRNLVTQDAGGSIGFAVLWPFVLLLEIDWFHPATAPGSVTLITFHDMPCELPSRSRKGSQIASIWSAAIQSQVPAGLQWNLVFLKQFWMPLRDLTFNPSSDSVDTSDLGIEFLPEWWNSHYGPLSPAFI